MLEHCRVSSFLSRRGKLRHFVSDYCAANFAVWLYNCVYLDGTPNVVANISRKCLGSVVTTCLGLLWCHSRNIRQTKIPLKADPWTAAKLNNLNRIALCHTQTHKHTHTHAHTHTHTSSHFSPLLRTKHSELD